MLKRIVVVALNADVYLRSKKFLEHLVVLVWRYFEFNEDENDKDLRHSLSSRAFNIPKVTAEEKSGFTGSESASFQFLFLAKPPKPTSNITIIFVNTSG